MINYKIIADKRAEIKVYRPSRKDASTKMDITDHYGLKIDKKGLLMMKIINSSKLLGFRKDGTVVYYKWASSVSKPETTKNSPFKCSLDKEKGITIGRGKGKLENEVVIFRHEDL